MQASAELHSFNKQDILFRVLYLRREFQLLSTIAAQHGPTWAADSGASTPVARSHTTPEKENTQTGNPGDPLLPSTRVETFHEIVRELRDVILLPPAPSTAETGSPDDLHDWQDSEGDWQGLVCVRSPSSPWYQGYFNFIVHFPPRYPFETPTIHLTRPLRSHPLLLNRVEIPFEEVYCGIDPMRVSVMARLLQHVRRFFTPAEWPTEWRQGETASAASTTDEGVDLFASQTLEDEAARINRVLARQDVERCSILQEIILSKPYAHFLGTNVKEHFLSKMGEMGGSDEAPSQPGGADLLGETNALEWVESREWPAWYNRHFLLRSMKLP
ncbi:unnamed protein product [Phytomonas sp. EM1]|nr:unnamed protein product [Phytomonas sp. EM1]|eukprot:CCW62646.1 unnamed protein product [Phytomonas sp. isolate EM1]